MEIRKSKLLIISQVYPPDPAAVGHYLSEVAEEHDRRGGSTVVFSAREGYEDTRRIYRSEIKGQLRIVRLPFSSFGKSSMAVRIAGQLIFLSQAIIRGIFEPDVTHILISTAPPMGAIAALVLSWCKRVPVVFWLMDLNPDQAVILGRFSERSILVRLLNVLNRAIYNRADRILVLDRFMAERVKEKAPVGEKLLIIPPWPQTELLEPVAHSVNPFRKQFPDACRIFLFSGNLSAASPLTVLVKALPHFHDRRDLYFLFIGGGLARSEIEEYAARTKPENLALLPFQPIEQLKFSLSAGDIHIVSMGKNMAGIIHPSKFYAALAVGRPVLYLGPKPSPIADLIERHEIGWQCNSDDPAEVIRTIEKILALPQSDLDRLGNNGRKLCQDEYARSKLLQRIFEGIKDFPQSAITQ